MRIPISRSSVLDAATVALVAVAVGTLAHDRVLPALADRARLDPGDRAEGLLFRGIASGDTVGLTDDTPSLVVVFRSTCPVCEETVPDWAELHRIAPRRLFAVGLEAATSAADWAERQLPGVELVVPLDADWFTDRLRIRAVPTTLLFEGRRLVLSRVGPLQPDDRARIHRAFRGVGRSTTVLAPRLQLRR
ncbi:MAG: TlpA family protein disulfide reductase [Gemmatimonadota bacterium]